MLVLIGKSASGKDKTRENLTMKQGFHSVITYTTRPMRTGEIQDITYHYISKDDFLEKIKSGFFAEWKKYDTNGETWYYGSAKEDLKNADENSVIILTPDGVRDVQKSGINNMKIIYLYANDTTITKRLNMRGDNPEEVKRRMKKDRADFNGAEYLADRIVYNNLDNNIDDVTNSIVFHYKRMCKDEKQ